MIFLIFSYKDVKIFKIEVNTHVLNDHTELTIYDHTEVSQPLSGQYICRDSNRDYQDSSVTRSLGSRLKDPGVNPRPCWTTFII